MFNFFVTILCAIKPQLHEYVNLRACENRLQVHIMDLIPTRLMHTTRDREQKKTAMCHVKRSVLYYICPGRRGYVHPQRRVEYGAKSTVYALRLRHQELKWRT